MTSTSKRRRARHGVIVGVDGSPQSRVAVDWAARDAALRSVPLTVVHVMPTATIVSWMDAPVSAAFWEERDRRAEAIVGQALDWVADAITSSPKIPVRHHLALAPFVPTLVDLSEAAELMVVGCRGLGGVAGLLLGSVSTGLVHRAHCPVAVIHDEDPLMPNPSRAPVVVGVDESPASEPALEIAFYEASLRNVELHAVSVWTDVEGGGGDEACPGVTDWAEDAAREALAERLSGWIRRRPEVEVRTFVERGHPARRLLQHGGDAQLLVVGSHGRGGLTGRLLGSVSSAVAQGARMPVIVARQG